MSIRYVAIGDSFTEGVGDESAAGGERGWADLVAAGWAQGLGQSIEYANLAVRGLLIEPIVERQLETALSLKPTHLSFNGGGNDMLRPRPDMERMAGFYRHVLDRCDAEGVRLIVTTGASPVATMPLGSLFKRRGDLLCETVLASLDRRDDVVIAINWTDPLMTEPRFWSDDRLHLNTRGHHRVAARVLAQLDIAADEAWWDLRGDRGTPLTGWPYYRDFVGPWLGRRFTGRSSGDGRSAKQPDWMTVPA